MEQTEIKLKMGDLLRMGNSSGSIFLAVSRVGEHLLECREVVRVPGNLVISKSWFCVNEDINKYNKEMHEDGLRGITHVYRFKQSHHFPVSHGIIGNAYDMLTYGINDFRIFMA